MCVLEESQWIRTKSVSSPEFFHGTLELLEDDVCTTLLLTEGPTRRAGRARKGVCRPPSKKLTCFDTKEYALPGISEEFRPLLSPVVMAAVLQRISKNIEVITDHSLDIRRYYRKRELLSMKLIALGDNVIDYYHNTQECFPGGNAVNVAVHAARLGAQAEYLGSLGDDNMAHIVEKALQENGVDISHCPILQGRTTKVCSYDVVNGERSFLEVITGESWTGPLQITAQELDELKTADLIVSSCNAKMPEQMAAVQALPAVFAYDFGEKESTAPMPTMTRSATA